MHVVLADARQHCSDVKLGVLQILDSHLQPKWADWIWCVIKPYSSVRVEKRHTIDLSTESTSETSVGGTTPGESIR